MGAKMLSLQFPVVYCHQQKPQHQNHGVLYSKLAIPAMASLNHRPFPLKSQTLALSIASPTSPPLFSQSNLDRRHFLLLNFAACGVAISAAWLFLSAIPTLLAFKKAAESLEKLLDVTADVLPGTMAAIRLSGMEISDLTTELSDLGQSITQGVKASTQTVRVAEERLRYLTTMAPTASMQRDNPTMDENEGPAVARAARKLRKGIVNGRAAFGLILGISRVSSRMFNFFISRRPK